MKIVEELGEIELTYSPETPSDATVLLPIVTQDGEEFDLVFSQSQFRELLETLSAFRQGKPAAFGTQ